MENKYKFQKILNKRLIALIIVLICVTGVSVMAYAYSSNPDLSYDNNSGYFFLCFNKEDIEEWVKIKCKVANGYDTNVNHKKKIEMSIEGYYGKYNHAFLGINQIQNIYDVQLVDENGNKGTTAQYWVEKDYFDKPIEAPGVIYARLPLVVRTNLEKGYYWNASIVSDDTSQDADNSNLNEKQLDQSTFSFSIDTNNVGMTAWGINDGDNHHCKIYLKQEEYPVYKINLNANGGTIKYGGTAKSQMSKEDNYLVECKSHQWGYVLDKKFWDDDYSQFWTKVHALSDKKVFYLDDSVKYPKLDITAEKENNIFLGYYYNDVQIIDENGQLKVDYDYFDRDVTITAKWRELYKITFDTNGGTLNYFGYITKPAYGQVSNNSITDNYILQDKGIQWAVPTTESNKDLGETYIKYYAAYGETPFLNMNVPVPTVKVTADKEGFVFNGFTTSAGKQIIDAKGNWSSEVDYNYFTSNTTLYAQYAPADNVKYVVNHWKQKLYYDNTATFTNPLIHNEANYSLADMDTFTGVTDSKVTPERKNYNGFTAPSGIEVTIKSDGSTVVDYYYTRNSYILTVKPNGSTWNGSTENRSYTLRYEEEMNIPNPSRVGYIFKKWIMTPTDKGSLLTDKNNTSKIFKMGYANTTLTVTMGKGENDESWEPIKYTITYDRNTPVGSLSAEGGETPDSHHTYDVSSKLSENGFILDGYTFAGWKWNNKIYGDSSNKGAIDVINLTDVNGSTITMYAQWTPVDNVQYVVNHWKQKLYYDGTTDYTDATIHNDVNYSLSDIQTFTDGVADEQVTPEVNHYTGFTSPSQVTVKIKGDGSTVVNYYYTRNEYDVGEDDGNGGLRLICGTGIESTSGAGRYKYGEVVSIDAEVQDGYTWYQWTGTIQAYKKDYMFYMPAYNVVLTANATPDKYKIYFDGNKLEYSPYSDLTLEITEKEVTYMQPLGELPIPTLEGARFDGWYTTRISDGEQWTEDTLYPKVGTKMLYARWTDITEPEGDIEDSYICPFNGTNISFNCKDTGGSGLKAINLYRGTEVNTENIVTDNTLTVDIVNEEGNCYGILANSFKANPDGDNYYVLEIIDNAGNTTTKVFELVCGEPLTWQAKLWRLNKSYAMAGTSDSLVYWTDGSGVYGDMTGFIQTDIEGHVDRIEYEFVDDRIPNIVTEIENAHENDTYTDNVQFTLPKERPGYASYVKVKLYKNVGTSHETVDVKTINFRIDKYDFSRIRTRIRVTSGMYIPENEKGHVPVY